MTPCSPEQLTLRLKTAFDVEFTFHKVNHLVDILAPFDRDTQDFSQTWSSASPATTSRSATNSPAA